MKVHVYGLKNDGGSETPKIFLRKRELAKGSLKFENCLWQVLCLKKRSN